MAVPLRLAMTWGLLPVRTWERSSAKVTSVRRSWATWAVGCRCRVGGIPCGSHRRLGHAGDR